MAFGRSVASFRSAQLDVIDIRERVDVSKCLEDDVSESTEGPSVNPGRPFSEAMYFSKIFADSWK